MKVRCDRLPAPSSGISLESSPWVRIGADYTVLSILINPRGRNQLRILDDSQTMGLFDPEFFSTVDETVPENWVIRIVGDGIFRLAPEAWLADGFWEAYYDGDAHAAESVAIESKIIMRNHRL